MGSTSGPETSGPGGPGGSPAGDPSAGDSRDPYARDLVSAPTLWELIEARARRSGERLMLLDEAGTRVSFGRFRDRAERVAAALHAAGIGPGSRVAWQLPTRVSTYLVMAALARLGAVQAPIIPLYREREVTAAVSAAQAQVMLVPGRWRGIDYEAMAAGLRLGGLGRPRVIVVDETAPESDDLAALPPPPADPGQVRWVYFTSGSTGLPKGVRHADRGLLLAGHGFTLHGRLGERPDEMAAIAVPIAHVGGVQFLIALLTGGFPAVLIEVFDPARNAEVLRRHAVTMSGGSTALYGALLAEQRARGDDRLLPALRLLKGGGAPCPAHLFHAVRAEMGVTIAHDYGMTEVPMICVSSPGDAEEALAETEGRPIPGVRLRIAGPDRPVPAGEEGEVEVSGPVVFGGYTDPVATAAAFTPDGWFRTGDWGRLRPDGHVELTGRLKDMIIRKGENIAPVEIEELLTGHPRIAEAAVIGLPDAERGERVCAVISAPPGVRPPTLSEIGDHLAEAGLMIQKFPEQVEVLDGLPRTGLGKPAKAELRERFSGEPSERT